MLYSVDYIKFNNMTTRCFNEQNIYIIWLSSVNECRPCRSAGAAWKAGQDRPGYITSTWPSLGATITTNLKLVGHLKNQMQMFRYTSQCECTEIVTGVCECAFKCSTFKCICCQTSCTQNKVVSVIISSSELQIINVLTKWIWNVSSDNNQIITQYIWN